MEKRWSSKSRTEISRSRSLFGKSLSRSVTNDTNISGDIKGPFGLNTLFCPAHDAIADMVFVHGLGGGSRSTWTKSSDPELYWPQVWLPQDEAFHQVRIHSFGFDSNWDKESILNIHDFAKALLASIQDCPSIPAGSTAPLIFVGHSMGGLVIKKAFILARQIEDFESIANRVRTIFFMATPHRGSDLAQVLSKVLAVAPGARPFVSDLNRNSMATQSINDEFPQHCRDLQLFSFYETVPTNYYFGKGLIVDKDLATLGYSNERTAYLNANHREVVKFSSIGDPNYIAVRNSLAFAVSNLKKKNSLRRHENENDSRRRLEHCLGVSGAPDDDLMRVDAMRMEGSNQWIFQRAEFLTWCNGPANEVYWVNAQPASGKSVLAGAVISHLKRLGLECSYFFFDHSNRLASTVGFFLRSMICQTASFDAGLSKTMLEKCDDGESLMKSDHRTIWRRFLLEGILKTKLSRLNYWVIDALDECEAALEVVPLLLKIAEISSIRIFVTCRNAFEAYRQIKHPKVHVVSHKLSSEDTREDIELYIRANIELLPLVNEEARNAIEAQILSKSAGCFLWVNLVLQELRHVHTSGERRQVWRRSLQATYGSKLAKAILTWAVCSVTPLTIEEMHFALEVDMQDTIDNMRESILSGCGQLVYVDAKSHVQIIHQTARDFLLRSDGSSEFSIDRKAGHKRLLMTCLEYLLSDEMGGLRNRKLSVEQEHPDRSSFVRYACGSLAHHITHADSADDDCLIKLARFLSSYNVLCWIEDVAQNLDLGVLVQTGKALSDYLRRRSKHKSLLGKEVVIVDAWSTDLRRLVTKFGVHLSSLPASIFQLIPSFCPRGTAIKKQFSSHARGFAIEGLSAETWDDCLATLKYREDSPVALATSEKYFAVGLLAGSVRIYGVTTCQEIRSLAHGECLKSLAFGDLGTVLVSAGLRSISVWNLNSGKRMRTFSLPAQCLSLLVEDQERLMIAALNNNSLVFWDLMTGQTIRSIDWTQDWHGRSAFSSRPTAVAFGLELNLLAIVYRGQDILLWDLESCSAYESYAKDGVRSGRDTGNATVWCLTFSLAPGTALLAAGYSDGDLVLFDVSMGIVKEMTIANAQTLTSSSDGYTLASADSSGTIQIFDFESLKLLYRITSVEEFNIRSLAFSADGQRLLDLRGSVCRVWDPMILSRQDINDENSDTVSTSTIPHEVNVDDSEEVPTITALCYLNASEIFLAGKDDGSVFCYDANNGSALQNLFCHAGNVSIMLMHFESASSILSTLDSSNGITARRILPKNRCCETGHTIVDYRAGQAVDHLLANKGNTRLLVSSAIEDKLWSITNDGANVVKTISWKDRRFYAWKQHPVIISQLILINDSILHIYDWNALERLTGDQGVLLEGSIIPELAIKYIMPCFNGQNIATAFAEPLSPRSKSRVLMWSTADFDPGSNKAAPIPSYQPLADQVECLIGAFKDRLLFLHSSGWICSADSSSFDLTCYVRHFFIPADWLSSTSDLLIDVTARGSILFAKGNEVAVIRRGLEMNSSAPMGHRPSLALRKSSPSPSTLRGRLSSIRHRDSH